MARTGRTRRSARRVSRTRLLYRDPLRYATPEMRRLIFARDNATCRYCGAIVSFKAFNAEHVTPWKLGGPTNPSNLVVACSACNRKKLNKYIWTGTKSLRNQPWVKDQHRAANARLQANRQRRLSWWDSLSPPQQAAYLAERAAEREIAALDAEFQAIIQG